MATKSFSTLYDTFLALRKSYLQPSTFATMRDSKRSFLRLIPDKSAEEYTGLDILEFVRLRVEAGRKPQGINVDLGNLRTFGNWCKKQKLLSPDNPFSAVELLKVPAHAIRYLTQEEFRLIFNAEPKKLLRQIYLTGLVTGMRCSDVLRLRWEMFDFDRALIRTTNTKGNRANTLPMHPLMFEVIKELGIKPEGVLFAGRHGKKLTPGYVSHMFLRAARKANVENATFHSLRRTFASWLALSGVGLHEIQKLLGHSTVTLTEKYYAGLVGSDLHGVVAMVSPVTGSLPILMAGPEPDSRFRVDRKVTMLKM